MKNEDKDELDREEEEKEILLEYIQMQNEVLKRIYKNSLEKDKEK
ncbi:hypothetical protein QNH20_10945 [Neobacillus sp. WH10]|nr:hypothetical protein [Neobacillus sp. WH10]WHY79617.1 hypothetical protein QNH20_10945 [Neobacillus sp. WH10]